MDWQKQEERQKKRLIHNKRIGGAKHRQSLDLDGDSIYKIETVVVLETQVDDMTSQAIAYTTEKLLQNGALDVYTQAIAMKKSRSGTLITVICDRDHQSICEQILFQETSTLGIRFRLQERKILNREIYEVMTEYGSARVKIAKRQGFETVQPEYEDCAKLARSHNIPLTQVQQAVFQAGIALLKHKTQPLT